MKESAYRFFNEDVFANSDPKNTCKPEDVFPKQKVFVSEHSTFLLTR
jgi:hypothetical protein